jgi:oxygen-independent coproporphyrinogen-3 oxidase
MWQQQLIEKYNITGPRYTSYPTALQFEEDFGNEDFKNAINHLDKTQEVSLYIHIPFCNSVCNYCACNKVITKNKQRAEEYLDYLFIEIERTGLLVKNRPVKQIHFGGGTPTYLSDEQLVRLIDKLEAHFNLVRDNHLFSIEVDPRAVGSNTLSVLSELGFNRISIGIQDFDSKVQQAVNRIQPEAMSRKVIEQSRQLGFDSVSVDLIYGLPHQTPASFAKTIETIIDIRPDRLSLFNYAHLPHRFKPQRRIVTDDLPTAQQKLEIFHKSIERLCEAGHNYIGMDHFALPDDELSQSQRNGTLFRNFQGYTSRDESALIGLGVSSISQVSNCYAQNQRDLYDYYESLEQGDLAVWRGCYSDEDDVIRREVIMQLICQFKLDFHTIQSQFGIDFARYFGEELAAMRVLESDGLLKIQNDTIVVLPIGRLLIRNICMVFDAYLGALAMGNYSAAI